MEVIVKNLTEEEKIEMDFFKKKLVEKIIILSPSAIQLLIDNPLDYFYKYVCSNFDKEETKKQKRGTLIHTLLLEEAEFNKRYVIMPANFSKPSDRVLELIDQLIESIDTEDNSPDTNLKAYSKSILAWMKDNNFHQSLVDDAKTKVTGDEKRLAKIITDSNQEYFSTMLKAKGKEPITSEQYKEAKFKVELIQAIEENNKLKVVNPNFEDVVFELELEVKISEFYLPLKCIIDAMKIDISTRKIYVTDLKNTGESIMGWINFSVEKYRVFVQAAIIYMAVENFKNLEETNELVPGIKDFQIEFGFAVLDGRSTTKYVEVTDSTMQIWIMRTKALLNENVKHHFETFDFSTTFELLNQKLIL